MDTPGINGTQFSLRFDRDWMKVHQPKHIIKFDLYDVPEEVKEAYGILYASRLYGVGTVLLQRFREIEAKYPEYFDHA